MTKPKKCKNCGEPFEPQRPLQKSCGYKCAIELKNSLSKILDIKPIRKLSKKREIQNKEYLNKRKRFLNDKICPITGFEATEIHHKKGRTGELLTNEDFWLAVSREGHIKIENNPQWAYEQGYSLKRI